MKRKAWNLVMLGFFHLAVLLTPTFAKAFHIDRARANQLFEARATSVGTHKSPCPICEFEFYAAAVPHVDYLLPDRPFFRLETSCPPEDPFHFVDGHPSLRAPPIS